MRVCLTHRERACANVPGPGTLEMARPGTGLRAGSETTPAHDILIIPCDMDSYAIKPGDSGGGGEVLSKGAGGVRETFPEWQS